MGLVNFLIKIGLDTTDVQLGAKRVESAFTGLGNQLQRQIAGYLTVGAITGGMTALARATVNAADKIGDMAEQYNLTTDEVQKLMVLSNRSGIEFEKFGNLLLKISELRAKALEPGKDGDKARAQFAKFGVDISKPILEMATQMSKALNGVTEDATALDIVGTRGAKALSVLQGIKDLGPIKMFTPEDIKAISDAEEAMVEFGRQATVAAGPTFGFWGRVLGRFNKRELNAGDIAGLGLQDIINEMMDDGSGSKTDALTPADLAKRRAQLFGGGRAAGTAGSPDADPITRSRSNSQFQSENPVAALGGYYLGADATARNDLARQTLDFVKQTAKSSKATEMNTSEIKTEVRKALETTE